LTRLDACDVRRRPMTETSDTVRATRGSINRRDRSPPTHAENSGRKHTPTPPGVAHHVSRRRLELCFASYLILICGQFGSSLALA